MDSIPTGLKHPEEYASMISADNLGNGQIAAQILASCMAQGATIGLVNFGVDYFSTNERTRPLLSVPMMRLPNSVPRM